MITSDNYFSLENQMKYMGSSQYKDFLNCEAMALAKIKGEFQEEKTTALLVGSYVDRYFEGTLETFIAENPGILSSRGQTKGELKADYKQANYIIARLERDKMFSRYMSGEKQVIMTGEIEGVSVKIKIDSYHRNKAIVDLKIMKDFEPTWKDGLRLNFIEAWGYDIQGGGFYQEIVRQNTGLLLPFIIAGATKEKEPDLAIIQIPQERLDYCLEQVKSNIRRFDAIKKGKIEPARCGGCDYCRKTKVLKNVITYDPTKADIFEGVTE